jgi:bifunctional DNA-binding transcriptional regulator/antitoxin component of YhaV-PrlF toxin-antitoxin module
MSYRREVEEPEIAMVGTKGQFVIPKDMRRQLAIKLPTAGEELDEFFAEIDERGKRAPSEREILKEIQAYRSEKRARTE